MLIFFLGKVFAFLSRPPWTFLSHETANDVWQRRRRKVYQDLDRIHFRWYFTLKCSVDSALLLNAHFSFFASKTQVCVWMQSIKSKHGLGFLWISSSVHLHCPVIVRSTFLRPGNRCLSRFVFFKVFLRCLEDGRRGGGGFSMAKLLTLYFFMVSLALSVTISSLLASLYILSTILISSVS